ncbi:MAG: hypothetical protein AABY22_28000 [Nanoarchaeota archaeon]
MMRKINKKELELLTGIAKIFKALNSVENLDLFLQIAEKPILTTKLKSDLAKMPLNRRLNILRDAGLIKRDYIKGKNHPGIENSLYQRAKKISRLLLKLRKQYVKNT